MTQMMETLEGRQMFSATVPTADTAQPVLLPAVQVTDMRKAGGDPSTSGKVFLTFTFQTVFVTK